MVPTINGHVDIKNINLIWYRLGHFSLISFSPTFCYVVLRVLSLVCPLCSLCGLLSCSYNLSSSPFMVCSLVRWSHVLCHRIGRSASDGDLSLPLHSSYIFNVAGPSLFLIKPAIPLPSVPGSCIPVWLFTPTLSHPSPCSLCTATGKAWPPSSLFHWSNLSSIFH